MSSEKDTKKKQKKKKKKASERKWPDDYLGSQKEIWSKIDVTKYLKGRKKLLGLVTVI